MRPLPSDPIFEGRLARGSKRCSPDHRVPRRHGETRNTKRVRLFTEFISRRLAAHAPLFAGLSVARD